MHAIEKISNPVVVPLNKIEIFNDFYQLGMSPQQMKNLQIKHKEIAEKYEIGKLANISITYVPDITLSEVKAKNAIIVLNWNRGFGKRINVKSSDGGTIILGRWDRGGSILMKDVYYCFDGDYNGSGYGGLLFPLSKLPDDPNDLLYLNYFLHLNNHYAKKYKVKLPTVPYSPESLKQYILNSEWLYNAPFIDIGSVDDKNKKEILSVLGWLFNRPNIVKQSDSIIADKNNLHNYLGRIVAVFTDPLGNRFAVFKVYGTESYYVKAGTILGTMYVQPDEEEYNYIDPGRFFVHPDTIGFKMACGERILCKLDHSRDIFFIDEKPIIPKSADIVDDYIRKQKNATRFLNNDQVKRIITQYQARVTQEKETETQEKTKKRKIQQRIRELKNDPNLSFTLNEVKYTRDKFEYAGQTFCASNVPIPALLNDSVRWLELENLSFDVMFANFIERTVQYYKSTIKKGTIGTVDFTIETRTGFTKDKVRYTHTYINGKKINNAEVKDVLNRLLCFTNQADADHFIEQVSKCSLKIHKYLAEGITMNAHDPYLASNVKATFPLIRRNGKHLLALNKKEYPIKNLSKLLTIENARSTGTVINILSSPDIVEVDLKDLGQVIEKARSAYEEAILKAQQLLKTTEEKFNIKLEEIDLRGSRRKGYIIKGILRDYFVEAHESNSHTRYQVYDYPDGNPRCIVDKVGIHEEVGVDRLVNRIYALKNDKYVANQISTL